MADLTVDATLARVAEGFTELQALQAKQRATQALMLKLCIMRIKSPDSRKRREGIEALEQLQAMMEGKVNVQLVG